jgi:Ca2+-binding RTX toxin-like protein
MIRRTAARLGTLALGVAGAIVVAAPTHAVSPNVCSVTNGHLTITSTEQFGETRVMVGQDFSQGGADVVFVSTPASPVCYTQTAQSPRLVDLVDILVENQYGGPIDIDVSKPFTGASGLVPITVSQYTIPGTQVGLTISSDATSANQSRDVVPGSLPALDLDGDAVADVALSDQPGTNHTDLLKLTSGAGNDTLDLRQDTLPTGWPVYTLLDTGEGSDQVHGGPEQDWVTPGSGPDQVNVSTYDQVTVFGDFDTDVLTSDSLQGTELIYLDGNDVRLHPDDAMPNDGTDSDIESGLGDNVAGFRTYTTGGGNDVFVEPSGETAIGFDGGSGYDTFDASGLSFPIYVNSFQNNDEVDVSFPNQTFGVLRGVNRLVGTPYSDLIFTLDDHVTVVPGQGDDTVHAGGTNTTVVADAVADGADSFNDEVGDGTWDYSARTTPVSVTLDHVGDDGAPGEGDSVDSSDVRNVMTGSGTDTVVGDLHANVISTGAGLDTVLARGGNDTVDSGDGGDLLVGGAGDDLLYGGAGNDRLNGSAGDDDEYGLAGNDTFQQGPSGGDNGSDLMAGGDGTDTVTYLGRSSGVVLSNNGGWDDGLPGEYDRVGTDIEKLIGTNFADKLSGGLLADWLYGYGGADLIHGNGGNDVIDGGTAADKLYGDAGNDSLYAKDGTKDTVNGGTGTDKARRDAIDVLLSIEGSL